MPTKPSTLRYAQPARALKPLSSIRPIPTNSPEWTLVIRPRVLLRDLYTCKRCGGPGNVVDHVDGDFTNNPPDDSNYQTLCNTCHSKKTAQEDGGFGNPIRRAS